MSVTIILIVLTVAISYYAMQNADLTHRYIFHPYSVQGNNEWYRFVTSGFLHADFTHLFFNMLALYFFGRVVEYVFMATFGDVVGIILYLFIYIGGIIVSDIPTYLKHRDNPSYRALGASGGVSAVIFSSILFNPIADICLYFFICLPGFILGLLYLIYSYYKGRQGAASDNINHDAHFYGAVYGIVVSLILIPRAGPNFVQQLFQWQGFSF
jgi:membrane associated rhomboid family serine protease